MAQGSSVRRQRLLQVLGRGQDVHALLRQPELGQRVDPRLRRRRLGQRAPQVADRDLGRAADERAVGGHAQRVDHERVARRRHQVEVRGHPLGLGAARAASSSAARRWASSRCAGSIDSYTAARTTGWRTRPSASSRAAGRRARAQVAASVASWRSSSPASAATSRSSAPSPSTAAAVAKRRASSGRRESRSATARVTGSGPISCARRAFSARQARRPRRAAQSTSARTKSGLPPVAEWHAAANSGSGSRAVLRYDHRAHGRLAERGRPDHEHGRVGDQLGQQLGLDGLLRRPQARARRAAAAPRAGGRGRRASAGVGASAQCRSSITIAVGPPGGEVGGEPVEPVHDARTRRRPRSRRSAPRRRRAAPRGRPCPRARLVALLGRQRCQAGLEELAHHAVGELLLEVGAARDAAPRSRHPPRGCAPRRRAASCPSRRGPRSRPRARRPWLPRPRRPAARPLRPRARAAACSRPGRRCGAAGSAAGPSRARASRAAGTRRARPWISSWKSRSGRSKSGQHRRPEVEQAELAGQVVPDEIRGRAREQHLPTVTRVADARRLVDGEADVAVRADARLAGVQPHADAYLHVVRPARARRARADAAAAASIAVPALRKTTKNESPLVSISIPPTSEKAARRSRLWVESTSP